MFLIVAFPHGEREVCHVHCGRRKRGSATRGNSTAVSQRLWARTWTRPTSAIWLEELSDPDISPESDDEVMFALGPHDLIEADTQVFFR